MRFRDIILHNFWLKLFSVALGTLIWMAIHYGIHNDFTVSQIAINRRIPVTAIVSEGDHRMFKIEPKEVVVIAVGEERSLRKAAPKNIRVYVDLLNFRSRQAEELDVRADVPQDINVLEIIPPVVTVQQISP